MRVVIDTSAVIAVITNEAHKPLLIQATQNADLIAPASLHVEIGNAFSAMFKRNRITLEQAQQAVLLYRQIPIQQVEIDLTRALVWTDQYGIYAYDAYMLDCARQFKAPLLTLDGGLEQVARQAGLTVVEVR